MFETKNISKEELLNNTFYKLPKFLFTDYFKNMSNDSKILYAILYDRMDLSIKNNWFDKNGDVFIFFTNNQLIEVLQKSEKSIIKAKKELIKYNLLIEKRQGLNRPNMLYIRNCKIYSSGTEKNTVQELKKIQSIKTDYNKTDYNKTKKTSSSKNKKYIDDDVKSIEVKISKEDLEYIDNYISEFKIQYKAVLKQDKIKELFIKKGKDKLDYYLEKYSKFLNTSTEIKNIAGYFYKTVLEEYPTPIVKEKESFKPAQATNYEQREYDDEFFDSLYVNLEEFK